MKLNRLENSTAKEKYTFYDDESIILGLFSIRFKFIIRTQIQIQLSSSRVLMNVVMIT